MLCFRSLNSKPQILLTVTQYLRSINKVVLDKIFENFMFLFYQSDHYLMYQDLALAVAMVTKPHSSIPSKIPFRWGKISLAILDKRK